MIFCLAPFQSDDDGLIDPVEVSVMTIESGHRGGGALVKGALAYRDCSIGRGLTGAACMAPVRESKAMGLKECDLPS